MDENNVQRKKELKPWHGLVGYAVFFLFLTLGSGYLTQVLGIAGTVISELIYAGIAIGAALLFGAGLSEVFPLEAPRVSRFFGSLFLFGGVYSLSLSVSMVLQYFFPQSAASVDHITTLFRDVNPAVGVICMAIVPAICEELLFRGFLLSSVRKWKPWAAVLFTGVLFGAAHLDIFRFFPTALLGIFLAYIDLKTGSIFLGMLFHFFNNLFSVLSLYLNTADTSEALTTFGNMPFGLVLSSCMVLLSFGLVGGIIGWCVLNDKKITFKVLIITAACSIGVSVLGTFCGTLGVLSTSKMYLKQLDDTRSEITEDFTVEEETPYTFISYGSAVGGTLSVTLTGPEGEIFVLDGTVMETRRLTLPPGDYSLSFRLTPGEEPSVSGSCYAASTVMVEKGF